MTSVGGWRRTGLAAIAALACLVLVVWQVRLTERSLLHTTERLLTRTFGSSLVVSGPVEIRMLPRPRLLLTDVRFRDEGTSLQVAVAHLEATPTFASLFSSAVAFEQIRLLEPTISLDADRVSSPSALNLLGRVVPDKVVVMSGLLTLHSANPALAGTLTGLDAVLAGVSRNSTATLSGHAVWRGQRTEVTARLGPFFDFMVGRPTTGSLRLRLPATSATIEGVLHAGIHGGFEGQVSAETSSLSSFLKVADLPARLGAVVNRVAFNATGLAGPDGIVFSNTRVSLDEMSFDGSLAWQPTAPHGAWTGTFATDTLDLTHALNGLSAWSRDGQWNDARIGADSSQWSDVDIRISANEAKFGPASLEDAAISALCRNGRVEVSLNEARTYDGMVRGRAVASFAPAVADLKVDVSAAQLDLESLGRGIFTGTASGHFTAQARGSSPRALIADLGGRGQVSVRQGSLPALDRVADLSSIATPHAVRSGWDENRSFDLGTADLTMAKGILTVAHGRVVGPSFERDFQGQASLLDRAFSLVATEGDETTASQDPVTSSLGGIWGSPLRVLSMDRSAAPGQPPMRSPATAAFVP